ncbi:hypothetical protein LNO81_22680 [Klebsiella variicola subsp. variicola]|nr:hypothetical protein [Klebsiella variicola subsp. variicola]
MLADWGVIRLLSSITYGLCSKNNIKVDDTFDSLSLEKKNLILYGESAEKLSFRFKYKGKLSKEELFIKA